MADNEAEVTDYRLRPKMFWTADTWKEAVEGAQAEVTLLRQALGDAEEELDYFKQGYKRQYHREYRTAHRAQKREANKRWMAKRRAREEQALKGAQEIAKKYGRVSL
jgi:predicted  nucleic acid-binding Zn-ribbon protein